MFYSTAVNKLTHGGCTSHSRAHDTVGAVAVDCAGNVACATSTGGIRNKMVGRVGDCPIIGKTSLTYTFSNGTFYTVGCSYNEMKWQQKPSLSSLTWSHHKWLSPNTLHFESKFIISIKLSALFLLFIFVAFRQYWQYLETPMREIEQL